MNPLNFAAVGLGAALGGWCRWLLGMALNPLLGGLPLGTLVANLIGGYLVGIAAGVFYAQASLSLPLKLFLITGFLGGLTTFSSFSAETVERLMQGEQGWAFAMILLHVLGSLTLTWLGFLTVGVTRLGSPG